MADQSDEQAVQDPGPGVHVVVHPEPLRAGRAVAEAIGGQLITMPAMAEAVVARLVRLPEARRVHADLLGLADLIEPTTGFDRRADQLLLACADDLPALAARRALDERTAARLVALTAELAALEGLDDRTAAAHRSRFAAELGMTPGIPVRRPASALRAAAAAVVAEEAAVADATASVALHRLGTSFAAPPAPASNEVRSADEPDLGGSVADDLPDDEPAHDDPPAVPADLDDRTDDGSMLMALGVFMVGLFLASLVVLTGMPTVIAVVCLSIATAIAVLVAYSIKVEHRHHRDAAIARHALALATDAPSAPPARRRPPARPVASPALPPRTPEQQAAEGLRRTEAEAGARARLQAAERAWRSVVGADVDPHAVEAAAHPAEPEDHDPVEQLVAAAPAVTAIRSVRASIEDEWHRTWAALGRAAPPADDAVVELLLADLRETAPDPAEATALAAHVPGARDRVAAWAALEGALDGADLDALRASAPDDEDLDARPVVLVRPFEDLGQRRREALRHQLDQMLPELTVVVIVQSAEDVPRATA